MTKRVIDLRTPEEKAAWIANKKIEDDAMAKGNAAVAEAVVSTCPRCSNPADDGGNECPFVRELYDHNFACMCCLDCRNGCAIDI